MIGYAAALTALLDDDANDAVLVINVPTALASAAECAAAVIAAVSAHKTVFGRRKPVLAVWIGQAYEARGVFEAAGIPAFQTENDAVRGFMHLVGYADAQRALMEVPASLADGLSDAGGKPRAIVAAALAQGRRRLDPLEVSQVLEAYAISVAPVIVAVVDLDSGIPSAERAQSIFRDAPLVALRLHQSAQSQDTQNSIVEDETPCPFFKAFERDPFWIGHDERSVSLDGLSFHGPLLP